MQDLTLNVPGLVTVGNDLRCPQVVRVHEVGLGGGGEHRLRPLIRFLHGTYNCSETLIVNLWCIYFYFDSCIRQMNKLNNSNFTLYIKSRFS